MVKLDIYTSLITSVVIQIITGIIQILTIFINVPRKFLFLKEMMLLEIFVQLVEGSFYAYWLYNFKNILNVTPKRYLDWVITTPTMLINLIFYLIFLQYNDKNISEQLNVISLYTKEFYTITTVLILNWMMLLFGYLGEVSIIPVLLGVLIGFIPFLIYYYIIYKNYALLTNDGLKIYFYFLFFGRCMELLPFYRIKSKTLVIIF